MGSIFGSVKQPSAPPAPPPSTLRDEVNGVEQVPVTNADGSVTYVTKSIPLTADQQAQKDELDKIMQDSLAQIQELSATGYTPDADTQKVLDQWQGVQEKLLADQARARTQQEEQSLAQRGLSDSSAALEVRRKRSLDQQTTEQNLQLQKDELANQVRSDKLALQQNLYNLASSTNSVNAAKTQQAATQQQSQMSAMNLQRQASLLDYYNAQGSGGTAFGNAFGGGLGRTLGGTVGTALGGPVGGVAGTLLGSLFGR
ncbi:MAG: hypothetical protein GC129_02510 [Proteobacteria bacterium]|nr:hypothetical protein [Pseudomonadota bacterium]